MEKYIIAVDMDGTLLNSENKISERNRNVLQRLIDDGHYVVPATGRTRELIPKWDRLFRCGCQRLCGICSGQRSAGENLCGLFSQQT